MEVPGVRSVSDIYAVRLPPSALLTVYEALDFYRMHRAEDASILADVEAARALLGTARAIHVGDRFVDEDGVVRPAAGAAMNDTSETDVVECAWSGGCAAVLEVPNDAMSIRRAMQRQGWDPLRRLCPKHALVGFRSDADQDDE